MVNVGIVTFVNCTNSRITREASLLWPVAFGGVPEELAPAHRAAHARRHPQRSLQAVPVRPPTASARPRTSPYGTVITTDKQ